MKSPRFLNICQILLFPALLVLPSVFDLLLYGLPSTYDGVVHLWRIARMHDSIQNWILFPRWIPEMLLGYGYPTLNYYASSIYYLIELFALLGLGIHRAYIFAHYFLVWVGAVGMFLLARDVYGRKHLWASYVASVAYAYGPYLLINIYSRSAIAEIGAQALFPWIFWGFRRIWYTKNPKTYLVVSILSLGALAFTHTISLLIVPLFLLFYNLVLAFSNAQQRLRLLYVAMAMIGAMGISSFFWGPLLLERGYVAYTGFAVAKELMLPAAFLTLPQLISPTFFYQFSLTELPTLGLVQSIGALLGLLVLIWSLQKHNLQAASNRNEWLYWLSIIVVCVILMLDFSAPLWLSNDILPIIQSSWRLLAILQVPIALLTGAVITILRPRLVQISGAVMLMALLIVVHRPVLKYEFRLDARTADYNVAVNAYYDAIRGTMIDGLRTDLATQEFRPKWAELSMRLDPTTVGEEIPIQGEGDRKVRMLAANSHHLQFSIESQNDVPLRLSGYYFPGWRVILDGQEELEPYPSTNLGLLTVDMPAGDHVVDIVWQGTSVQRWSGYLSLLTLATICGALFWWRSLRKWLIVIMPLFIFGIVATTLQPRLMPIQAVDLPTAPLGLEFLGNSAPTVQETGINLSAYWFVTKTQPTSIQMQLQLLTSEGKVVQEVISRPFYNGYPSEYWAQNTLVDDGYWLPLPPGLDAGTYNVQMTLLNEESGQAYHSWVAGTVDVPQPTERPQPSEPLDIRFDQDAVLAGYDFDIVEPSLSPNQALATRPEVKVVYSGQTLAYTLYWRSERAKNGTLTGFLHLVDREHHPQIQQDQTPGPIFQPALLWTPHGIYLDSYQLPIAENIPSGLYIPDVGMYDWREQQRFDVTIPNVEGVFDHYELPPVKIINRNIRPSGIAANAQFGDMAELVSYEIQGAGQEAATDRYTVKAGDILTFTTYYRVQNPTSIALTRFVQMRNASNQIAAQSDSEPQEGGNPTWAWVKGELVQDMAQISIAADAQPGEYFLYLGFYDRAENFTRLPVTDRQGQSLPNDELLLQVGANPLVIQIVE